MSGLVAFACDPTPEQQRAAGCGDGHDPATATGVCARCGFDTLGYWDDECGACGAETGEDCRPWCIGGLS